MEVKKLTYGILTTILAVVLVSAVLIPAISSSNSSSEKENEGYMFTATPLTMDNQEQNCHYTLDSDNNVLVNGEILKVDTTNTYTVGMSNSVFGVVYSPVDQSFLLNGQGLSRPYLTAVSGVQLLTNEYWSYTIKNSGSPIIEIDRSEPVFAAVNGGDYAVYNNGATFKVNAGETVYFYDQVAFGTDNGTLYTYRATIVDGVATLAYANKISSTGTLTDISSSVAVNCTYNSMTTENGVTTYTGLNVEITGITLGAIVSNCLAVPMKYTVTADQDNPVYTLINIIPLLVLVGVMLGAVGLFISRRD